MIKFQKDHTTPEQSKRLLELGIPADSANCTRNLKTGLILAMPFKPSVFKERKEFFLNAYPCWSALRLMEIYEICTGKTFERNDVYNIFSDIFTTIESALLNHKMDFSKLEE